MSSQHGGSQRGGPSGNNPAHPGYPAPLGHDPAKLDKSKKDKDKPKPMTPFERAAKRVEFPADAYEDLTINHTPFARRPGFNLKGGTPTQVYINQFRVAPIVAKDAYQYDVALSPEPEHPAVYQKVWDSNTVSQIRAKSGATWLYDGRKLAWSNQAVKEIRTTVDLDAEQGRPPPGPGSKRKPNKWEVIIKPTGNIRLAALEAYLKGKAAWDNSVLECMSFLDHVLRQGPSERMKLIKRVFYNSASETMDLDNFTEAIKGIYSTIRLNESINSGGSGLGVNVDVSNQTFWIGQKFERLVINYLGSINRSWGTSDLPKLVSILEPEKRDGVWHQSEAFKALRKLYNIRFEVGHRGKSQLSKEYRVKNFTFDKEKGVQNAQTVRFKKKLPDGKLVEVSILEYYKKQYGTILRAPLLPLIETTRAGCFPFEVCTVKRLNPYPFKLSSSQTQSMIKFAVQRPPQRKEQIAKMVANLGWGQDQYLAKFGIKINPQMSKVPAVIIKNPVLQFDRRSNSKEAKNGCLDPSTRGRWNLLGMKFLEPHPEPLVSWAFVIVDNAAPLDAVKAFSASWMDVFKGHGGKVQTNPLFITLDKSKQFGDAMYNMYYQIGNNFRKSPQMVFFVVPDQTTLYERIKKSAECRFAHASQVLKAGHVRKNNAQYCTNVSLKVNAKLGGATSGLTKNFFQVPTMIIGADVSHSAPGAGLPSMAAVCASVDQHALRYRAGVQTNGYRVEMITRTNLNSMLPDMIRDFKQNNKGQAPQHLFYLRDGVSEGQFSQVLEYEVEEFKNIFREQKIPVPKMTIIIATKRHHIRFFPERGDKNGNAFPGTVVEREVTHPFHYDFYLCSHVAIQGTARPVHYNVIHDEIKMAPAALQEMIYHQCYQYCRATTPISLHPAVYYAHLASNRARAHLDLSESDKNKKDAVPKPGAKAQSSSGSSTGTPGPDSEPNPLLSFGKERPAAEAEKLRSSMWWV
ncbi:Piwi domain containing protein [Naviculisporaceae sp. PSN 640]